MPRRAPAYVANLIPGLQAEGLSANQALVRLREQGLGVRRENFLRLWGATQKEAAIRTRLSTSDPSASPDRSMIVQVPRPKARGFQYNINQLARDTQTGEFYFTPTAVITDRLITFGEAINIAAANLRAILGSTDKPGYDMDIFSGGEVTSVLERVPEIEELF